MEKKKKIIIVSSIVSVAVIATAITIPLVLNMNNDSDISSNDIITEVSNPDIDLETNLSYQEDNYISKQYINANMEPGSLFNGTAPNGVDYSLPEDKIIFDSFDFEIIILDGIEVDGENYIPIYFSWNIENYQEWNDNYYQKFNYYATSINLIKDPRSESDSGMDITYNGGVINFTDESEKSFTGSDFNNETSFGYEFSSVIQMQFHVEEMKGWEYVPNDENDSSESTEDYSNYSFSILDETINSGSPLSIFTYNSSSNGYISDKIVDSVILSVTSDSSNIEFGIGSQKFDFIVT